MKAEAIATESGAREKRVLARTNELLYSTDSREELCSRLVALEEIAGEMLRSLRDREQRDGLVVTDTSSVVYAARMKRLGVAPHAEAAAGEPPVTLVRCRDCRFAQDVSSMHGLHLKCVVRAMSPHLTDDDGFCHKGELAEGGAGDGR